MKERNQFDREVLSFMKKFSAEFKKREEALTNILKDQSERLSALQGEQESERQNYSEMAKNYEKMAENYSVMERKFRQLLEENQALKASLEGLNSMLSESESSRLASSDRTASRRLEVGNGSLSP
tara:strand:- start:1217 stop:1591 length:375 start_codon:yes stop_codon:yes gene_type:complete